MQLVEAVVQKCSVKKLSLEISQNSQENTCARVSFLQDFCEIYRNTFLDISPLVAASAIAILLLLKLDQNNN